MEEILGFAKWRKSLKASNRTQRFPIHVPEPEGYKIGLCHT